MLVNGCPTDKLPLEFGLRQGDPLSPFLFMIAAEGLDVLMQSLTDAGPLIIENKSWANVRSMRAMLL